MNNDTVANPQECIAECEALFAKLYGYCVDMMYNRQYSKRAKHPYKVMSFVNAMTWRMYETTSAAVILIKQNLIIPSLCLVRATWEDMAVTYELKSLVSSCCDDGMVSEKVDKTLMRILFSNRFEKNNRYVGETHYEKFKEYKAKNILSLVEKVEKDFPQAKDFYSTICEFVHPNRDGVSGSYSRIDAKADITYFGPQFSFESKLFSAFVLTISCAIVFYIGFIECIKENMSVFTCLCEDFLSEKYDKQTNNI